MLPIAKKTSPVTMYVLASALAVLHDMGIADAGGGAASAPTKIVAAASIVTANRLTLVTVVRLDVALSLRVLIVIVSSPSVS